MNSGEADLIIAGLPCPAEVQKLFGNLESEEHLTDNGPSDPADKGLLAEEGPAAHPAKKNGGQTTQLIATGKSGSGSGWPPKYDPLRRQQQQYINACMSSYEAEQNGTEGTPCSRTRDSRPLASGYGKTMGPSAR